MNVRAALYRDTNVVPGTPYEYQLVARNFLSVRSDPSMIAGTTTPGVRATLPAAPTNLTATSVSRNQINIAWTDNSNNENSFAIERSTDGSTWTLWTNAARDATTYANTGLQRGVRYYYRVSASNDAGYSEYSNTASAVAGSSGAGVAAIAGLALPSENDPLVLTSVFSTSPIRLALSRSDEPTLIEALLG